MQGRRDTAATNVPLADALRALRERLRV